MRETKQRRSSAETFSLLQEQGDMKELELLNNNLSKKLSLNGVFLI